MLLKSIELTGFKSFAKKDVLHFTSSISGIVGPNGSGKSNVAEAFRFVLGEQSMKSMRGKRGEDLIFNGSPSVPRANRASVKLIFDNTDRFLSVDFDEVVIERSVHRDGVNEYHINGSQVRLRDIIELLAAAHVGSSGHHMISQGEADRILNANLRERREMIEDALGLKVFQYKKQEGQRKLQKTQENIDHVGALRKEAAPHLTFLERQVQKLEKSRTLRSDLKKLYDEYLKREDEYLTFHTEHITSEKKHPEEELQKLEAQLNHAKDVLAKTEHENEKGSEAIALEEELTRIRKEKDEVGRILGRIEGQMTVEERHIERERERAERGATLQISYDDVEEMCNAVVGDVEQATHIDDVHELRNVFLSVKEKIQNFLSSRKSSDTHKDFKEQQQELERLREEQRINEERLTALHNEGHEREMRLGELKKDIEQVKDESRGAERDVFRIMSDQSELRAKVQLLCAHEDKLKLEREDYERELTEASVILGQEVLSFFDFVVRNEAGEELSREDIAHEPRAKQEERRRTIEKIKIRIEEAGGVHNDEIMKEYKDAKDRDAFFERELADLETSLNSLQELIADLDEKLTIQFKEGIQKINAEFQKFFTLLFNGGTAKLEVVREVKRRADIDELSDDMDEEKEDDKAYEGIEVSVNLPHKRVRGLDMLSGGERALTSIALLFSMSQVNPPPFIILDETDAALDEANSKKYGDMIESLAHSSQLILITHNRETMSRAGVLYGVTMGSDGISKLLSVKLDEAVQVAK